MAIPPKRLERLRHNVLTEILTDQDFESCLGLFTEHRFAPSDVILDEGTEGKDLHLIVEGRVQITKRDRAGTETLLALLHAGDFFGELEVIDGRPRAARVTALDASVTYAIGGTDFLGLLLKQEKLAHRLLQVLSVRLRTVDAQFVRELDRLSVASDAELLRLRRLIEATKVLNSTLDLDKLLGVILETALGLVDGDRGTVYLVDRERQELWSRVLRGDQHISIRLPHGTGIAGYVAATGDTLNIPDAYFDPRFNPDIDKLSGYRTTSILCMPMRNRDGVIVGVFQLLNKHTGTFTAEDETILEALSVHAAIAVENARLHEQERQKIALEKDLQAAREVQMMLIPKRVPSVAGYDFAAATIPAREVGGDLYDFTPRERNQLAICLGDVSGKGLAASLLMANTQATLRDQALSLATVSECIRRSNMLLFRSTSPEKFVTLFYAVLDLAQGSLTACNAGHERPFLINASGEVRRLAAGGIVLGVLEDFPFVEETLLLSPGDTVVVFSDGVSEAMNEAGVQLGEKGIEEIVRRHSADSAEEIKDAVIGAVRRHVGKSPQTDDITVVVLKRTGEPAAVRGRPEQPTMS